LSRYSLRSVVGELLANGQRHVAPLAFKSKIDGLAWLSAVETEIRRGLWIDPSESKMTVGEWLCHWMATAVLLGSVMGL
jgi:hypothetical protein